LRRLPSFPTRRSSDLTAPEAPSRVRAALAVGRIGDPEALPQLEKLLVDPEAGPLAAWALGRIEGGADALVRCLALHCPSEIPARSEEHTSELQSLRHL